MNADFAKARGAVVAEAAVILAEVAERKTVQVPAMGRVAEGAEVGVRRRGDDEAAAGREHTMKLLHGADDVGDVLDDMNGAQLGEGAVADGIRKTVQVAEHVGARVGSAIKADRAGIFVDAAADVENAAGGGLRASQAYRGSFRHSSSVASKVSSAKSA